MNYLWNFIGVIFVHHLMRSLVMFYSRQVDFDIISPRDAVLLFGLHPPH
jgi:hypothetical protein